ncbi:transcriptional regulator [Streptomyces lunaelactis]|uniref:LuxR C-terminal-related transcriptional regulator n=1 Tax=Streptomyces lunaelactis TaxID=1535768 RepID=UPI00158496B4|nr:LuxR C-terminal-related transcriptional regulator [Streptomyces lunaelactis]NUK23153.1 transcriptional regulator [Streptomyces lunaelactis]NUK52854.1 transcriptional regulator [Streptomyces lunaelactis]NUK56854.1 transcriptional regulator [Streptomyces lunaelactis]NUK66652.1 transcriptional regulator [Streptomyces lunaelactis]
MKNPAEPSSTRRPVHRTVAPSGDPMLAVRFTVPSVPKRLVDRPALLERMTAGVRGPLTLVNGPAGAGKTVLAAQWVTEGLAPPATVWLTVEPGDAPGAFWAYVLEAFHRHGVRLPPEVGRPTRAEGVNQSLLVRLADALAESPEPVVLVLDQVDVARAPEIAEGLHFVLRHAGDGLRLVLTGRTDWLLPLHRYRAADEITEIRNADLRFTDTDAEALLSEHRLEISEAGIRLLVERTKGWAAGLRLCALAMQSSADPEVFVREFAADRTTIADYLLTEVLDTQPPRTQDLLLRASITDRINPELADVLTGRDDADQTLAGLARANAFLEQVDELAWYRLHPLFAEVLRAHLRQRAPGLEPLLRGRAARWFARTGRLTDAVAQAAAAGDWQFAAGRLVDCMAIGRLFTGLETEQLGRTFAAMPTDLTGAAPALVEAACRLADQDLPGCAAGLGRADQYLTDAAGPAARLSRAFVGVLAGRLAHDLAATEQAAADAERLLHEIPPPLLGQHPEIRAMVLAGLGAVELDAGRLDRAESGLTAAVEGCGQPGMEDPLCDSLGSLAMVELLRGRLRQAEEHARRSLAVAERSAHPPERRAGLDHLVLAGVAAEHDDLTTARTHLDLATMAAGPHPEPAAAVEAAVIGSRLSTAEGDWEGALATLHGVGSPAGPSQLSAWTVDELAIAESCAHLAHGDAGAALDVLDAVVSDRPEHAVARARALLAAGRSEHAMKVLAELPAEGPVTTTSRAQACLLQAQAAAEAGSTEEALLCLREALAFARSEELRRVFVESGPWVGRLLRQNPQLAQAHGWLPAHVLGYLRAGACEQLPLVVEPLSRRETEVLRMAAQLLSTKEIAAELYLSANTVKTHLKSIYRKLSVTRRSEAVHRARDLGVL